MANFLTVEDSLQLAAGIFNWELFTLPSHGDFLGNHHFLVYQDDVAVCFASAPYCSNPWVLCLQKTLAYGRQIFEPGNGMQFAEYRVAMVNGFKPTICIGTAGSRTGQISHHSLSRKELARGYA
jgi:hypothetical protein